MLGNNIPQSLSDKTFLTVNYAILTLFALSVLYPLIYVISASFSSTEAIMQGRVWLLPVNPTLDGYKAVFEYRYIWIGFSNSLFYAVLGTALNVVMTILAAYPLSRPNLDGKRFFMLLLVFATMFSGGLIPSYMLVKDLSMLGTRWALIIPAALSIWNAIMMRTYFKTSIPGELLEAAQIDGCSDSKYLTRIVIPLSGPIIAVVALFCAVGFWNQYFAAVIYLNDKDMFPLQLILRDILIQNEVDLSMLSNVGEVDKRNGLRELLKYSLIVVASAPVLIVYPFVQKHFVKGIMIGSLKG
ncbi:carbohydrate ABC transporter permease [Paenibacillus arenilitoris]|uniref:Carbohydrate ABC transporter permease n=1 Tax=Paenibacillus arenilitoris TaxID=2772299 RepID=A0A927CHG0_9BACL|nr:carbohydrate ABC transporter permease [Paenibacillus arenilitoris]MBD2867102.1 carbohydrate ABC transporter permease [Paenibacillus arenilitoris]